MRRDAERRRLPTRLACSWSTPNSAADATTFGATFEVHGQAKPACVAGVVFRYYP